MVNPSIATATLTKIELLQGWAVLKRTEEENSLGAVQTAATCKRGRVINECGKQE
jgi:hypothetical protein